MRKVIGSLMIVLVLGVLAACGGDDAGGEDMDDFVFLEVDFTVPETAEVGEEVEFHALVTYDEEEVTDAEVVFEVWESEDEEMENSVKFDGENQGDGTYTATFTFDEPGNYEMYAHTDAMDMHVMPLEEVVVEE